ncbi:MAG: FAD-dependent oxidoreductase [Actinobacteria bacterium]|nr:FAD-dependent oxidoreductase [Actinomycetota bacterium]
MGRTAGNIRLDPGTLHPRGGAVRSFWLERALAAESDSAPLEPVAGTYDYCVVGGGYTGLWTALQIKAREPGAEVIVLEADICGSGASGRNGGFVMTAWSKLPSLLKVASPEEALRYCSACEAAIGKIREFCETHAIAAEFAESGWLWVASNDDQLDSWSAAVEATTKLGVRPFEILSPDEARARSGSAATVGGVFEKVSATVQPATLARGLARVARERGVRICEQAPVESIDGDGMEVRTARGSIKAGALILATNAWMASLPALRRSLVVIASDVIATDPAPRLLEEIGLEPGLAISDSRRLVNYFHRREDGTMVFGKGGGSLTFGGRIPGRFQSGSPSRDRNLREMRRLYPSLAGLDARSSWCGPIDYSASGLPFFSVLPGHRKILLAAGYSGNGVGPSFVAGTALAEMALGGEPVDVPQAMRRLPAAKLPPEPLRYLGGQMVRAAIERKERAADAGGRASTFVRAAASLDPTGGLVDRG